MPGTPKPDERLPRSRILRDRREFLKIREEGRRLTGRWLTLNWRCLEGQPQLMAIIAPKLIGGAVQRNTIKRKTRECYRRLRPSLPEGLRSVWIARRNSGLVSAEEVRQEMIRLYTKAGLLKNEGKANA